MIQDIPPHGAPLLPAIHSATAATPMGSSTQPFAPLTILWKFFKAMLGHVCKREKSVQAAAWRRGW